MLLYPAHPRPSVTRAPWGYGMHMSSASAHTNLTPSAVNMARLLYFGTLATIAPFAHHSATIPAARS